MLVFFFQAVDYMLHGEFFVLKVFPGRWALPHFALTGSVALSRARVSGSWTGILYKNVKVGYKQSTFVIPTMFEQKNQILRR